MDKDGSGDGWRGIVVQHVARNKQGYTMKMGTLTIHGPPWCPRTACPAASAQPTLHAVSYVVLRQIDNRGKTWGITRMCTASFAKVTTRAMSVM